MKPASLDITIYQGSTFTKPFQWKTGATPTPVDLTGCTARMQVRKKLADPIVILELTTENNRIEITDPLEGKFEIKLTAEETAELDFKSAVYDFEIVYLGGEPVYRLFEGNVELIPEVTR